MQQEKQQTPENELQYREIPITNPKTGITIICYFHIPTEYSRYCARRNLEYLQKELEELKENSSKK